nr:MAG TPA: hypothetical protein [Caudoviricetes sp.]
MLPAQIEQITLCFSTKLMNLKILLIRGANKTQNKGKKYV